MRWLRTSDMDINLSQNTELYGFVWIEIATTVFCPLLALEIRAVLIAWLSWFLLRSGVVRGVICVEV